ncbi:MAG: ABC transporter permease [Rhodanobacteraceae bacterium]
MFRYYVELAVRGFLRNWALTALIVLTIGIGIGASMTMVTVVHVMSGDPLPGRSGQLFFPHLYPGSADFGGGQMDVGNAFTWPDANNLLRAGRAVRQAMMVSGRVAVSPGGNLKPFFSTGRYVSARFFAMFDTPFAVGTGWNAQADQDRAQVVVLNGALARKVFGSAAAAMGRTLHLQGRAFRVAGVLRDWHPEPLFYGSSGGDGAFKSKDTFFLPINTAMSLKLPITGSESCWGSGGRMGDHCAWVQFWVELDTHAEVTAYQRFLVDYWRDQKAHGRFPQATPPRLQDLMVHLKALGMVPADVTLQLGLALGFLAVCLFNTVGLMLAKFLRRSGEVSVRRAMGATRRDIFLQLGTEAAMLGLAGGLLGLAFTWFGLWLVRQRPDAYARFAHLDPAMVLGVFALAVIASVLAGLLPAWRACRIAPALQLKVQ